MALARSAARALVVVLLAACTPVRTTPDTRYLGMLLNARNLGAQELARVEGDDPAIRAAVATRGQPDFIVVPSPRDVELIWYLPSVLMQFHRPADDAASIAGTLSPLPEGLLNVLPADPRAGTPDRVPGGPGVSCWTVGIGTGSCRTCCAGVANCMVDCRS